MKKILFSFFLLTLFVFNKANAQCTIEQASIKLSNIVSVSNGTTCDVTFTLEFDIAGNGGNK